MTAVYYPLFFVIGLAILYVGAEALVKGSVQLARSFGVSPLVIGLTLVAFGTSAPEMSLDLTAALRGAVDLAFGDLVGSNIANIGLILGAGALVRPLRVQMRLLKVEVPIVIVVSLGLWALAADGRVSRLDGGIMIACFLGFLVYTYRAARREPRAVKEEFEELVTNNAGRMASTLLVVAGLAGLVLGAQLMVYAAVAMARAFGVSELVIGLTIVAVGTSLPELATSVVGAWRGEADIVVGNVVGSNIFNILWIMGVVAQVRPLPAHAQSLAVDLPVMIGFAVALVPIMLHGLKITRLEGTLLIVAFTAFMLWQAIGAAYPSVPGQP
jgi:cation:H+ antiporter